MLTCQSCGLVGARNAALVKRSIRLISLSFTDRSRIYTSCKHVYIHARANWLWAVLESLRAPRAWASFFGPRRTGCASRRTAAMWPSGCLAGL